MSQKGGNYERQFCRDLSLWWSGGADDNLFWRSQTSGGRATSRAARGKATAGHYGDTAALGPEGRPLIELVTIELKCGYNKVWPTASDLLDRPTHQNPTDLEEFFRQAILASRRAGSPHWLLVHRRDWRAAVAYLPRRLYRGLREAGAFHREPRPLLTLTAEVAEIGTVRAVALPLREFFALVDPSEVRQLHKGE